VATSIMIMTATSSTLPARRDPLDWGMRVCMVVAEG
jgi:hypothetical protein